MRFAFLCFAASLAAVVCAHIHPSDRRPSKLLHKRSPIIWQDDPSIQFSDDVRIWEHEIEMPSTGPPPQPSPSPTPPPTSNPSPSPTPPPTPPPTVDPMCPNGKDQPCRELPPGKQGSIQLSNDGWITLQFFVEYTVRGQKITKESGTFTWPQKKTIDIPADAEDIAMKVQNVGFGATSDIIKKRWKYPVIRCYSSIDGRTVTKVGCQ